MWPFYLLTLPDSVFSEIREELENSRVPYRVELIDLGRHPLGLLLMLEGGNPVERLKERLDVAQKALTTLQEVLAETNPTVIVRDAAIQRFDIRLRRFGKRGRNF